MARETITNFSVTNAQRWAAEPRDHRTLLRGGGRLDPSQFFYQDSVLVTVGAAGAAQNATTVPVAALSGPIPSGTTLDFGGAKFATLTAAAATGATSLTVRAIPTALVSGDVARYAGSGSYKKVVVSGTLIGRTFTERDAGTGFGPAVNTDDEIFVLAHDVTDADNNPDATLYIGIVKENFLPVPPTGALQTAFRAKYRVIRGTD